jgi:uncharacterized protein
MPDFRIEGEAVSFWIKVKPRSAREGLEIDSAGELRLAVNAPPVEGRATKACVRFLARALDLPRRRVEVLAGETSRRKLVRIRGHSARATIARLAELAEKKV